MELGASLHHLHLSSPEPQAMADFYRRTYDMAVSRDGDRWICAGAGRLLVLSNGPANMLSHAAFAFGHADRWAAFRMRVPESVTVAVPPLPMPCADALAVRDPDGNTIVFVFDPTAVESDAPLAEVPPAHLQHFAMRTTSPENLLNFYHGVLGFTISDRVQDDQGTLRACFLRTENLHHALALFMAPQAGFDHQSFETGSWTDMRIWGDHMGSLRETIVWGIGRHGPGNDVFFMVRDPDGNLAEISAEIEVCAEDRPTGLWVHEERTLNLWGKAIMRG